MAEGLQELPSNRVTILRNTHCIYCGVLLERDLRTKEHVIGRRFVPKGKLEAEWNLIAAACKSCNNCKADLEDDISAILMQPDLDGKYSHLDEGLVQDARHKGSRSLSRRTRKLVKDSHESFKLKTPIGTGATAAFKFTSPPQIDPKRAFELAKFHITAFFYLLTYDEVEKRGRYWKGTFCPLLEARRADWGNPIPAHRMKMKREHIVPLSSQALEIIKQIREESGTCELLFPGVKSLNIPISDVTLTKLLIILGYRGTATAHGMRATASTILNENGFKPDVIERQLAHIEQNKIRAAYHHAEYLKERKEMMQWWGDYLAANGKLRTLQESEKPNSIR